MNKLFKLSMAILFISQGLKAENTGNGTNTLAVKEILSDANDGLSVEEKIYKMWQESEGRQIPGTYEGCYQGLGVINREIYDYGIDGGSVRAPQFSLANLLIENIPAVKAMDIELISKSVRAVSRESESEFRENSSTSCEQIKSVFSLSHQQDKNYFLQNLATGSNVRRASNIFDSSYIEYREYRTGILVGVLFTVEKDGFPGYCPWSGLETQWIIVKPEVKNKKGKIIKRAVEEMRTAGWNINKRKDYKLENVCGVYLMYQK